MPSQQTRDRIRLSADIVTILLGAWGLGYVLGLTKKKP